jgi:tetratricopeptide (TPR) repeat protein
MPRTGAHRWAERYDREVRDVFAVQDEVARAIVATLAAHVNRAEIERVMLKPPAAWEAYDYYLRGAEAFLHSNSFTKASLHDARRLFKQSLAIDPGYVRAAALLSATHIRAYIEPFDGDYLSPAALDRAIQLAEAAVRLDPRLPQARAQRGYVLIWKRQHDAAIAEFERAFALNPNFIDHRFAIALIYAGDPARAIEVLEANMRLDPFASPNYEYGVMGMANYTLKHYEEAVRWLRECALRLPNLQVSHVWLACAYAQLGQLGEARAEAAEVLRINPGFTIESWKRLAVNNDPKDAEHRLDGHARRGCRTVEPRTLGIATAALGQDLTHAPQNGRCCLITRLRFFAPTKPRAVGRRDGRQLCPCAPCGHRLSGKIGYRQRAAAEKRRVIAMGGIDGKTQRIDSRCISGEQYSGVARNRRRRDAGAAPQSRPGATQLANEPPHL